MSRGQLAAYAEPAGAGSDVARAHRERAGVLQHAPARRIAQPRGATGCLRVPHWPTRWFIPRAAGDHPEERVLHGGSVGWRSIEWRVVEWVGHRCANHEASD